MPKLSGESLKTRRLAPKPQPSRQINHQPPASGPRVLPNAMGAPKSADRLKSSPGSSKPKPQQVF
jgi:hypothetical protein